MLNSVAVFCGSKPGNNPIFTQHASELGGLLASHNVTLIYGAGKIGLMGTVADAVLQHNGKVTGVIPEILNEREHLHNALTTLHFAEDMHARKKLMYELSDAIIILPGGYGTMDELFEAITWNQLSIHNKKIILLNSCGYYDHLIAHINKMQTEGFLYDKVKENFIIADCPQALVFLLDEDKNQSHRE